MTMAMSGQGLNPGPKKMFKVLCPIEKDDKTTYWIRVGTAFVNRDQSINLYLDVLPKNGRLQVRELDEDELQNRDARRRERGGTAMRAANDEQQQVPF